MSRLKQFLLKNLLHQQRKANKSGGFTLIEILVAMILTVLIITPLMTLVLSMMDTDRKEEAKATTETEIQAALNYIADDLKQAVYIYDTTALKTNSKTSATNAAASGIQDQIPPKKDGLATGCIDGKCVPVLVFWKRKYLDRDDIVDGVNIGTINDSIKGSDRYVYALVAYYLIKDNSTTWQGKARIARFEIRDGILDPAKNVSDCTKTTSGDYLLPPSDGFQCFDTVTSNVSLSLRMNRWTKGTSAYTNQVETLIDYVDDTALTNITDANILAQFTPPTNNIRDGAAEYSSICSDERTGLNNSGEQRSSRVPPDDIDLLKTGSFYACVNPVNAQGQSVAQVYIRGNALRRLPEYSQVATTVPNQYNINYFPISSVRVAVIGVLKEN